MQPHTIDGFKLERHSGIVNHRHSLIKRNFKSFRLSKMFEGFQVANLILLKGHEIFLLNALKLRLKLPKCVWEIQMWIALLNVNKSKLGLS